MKTIVPYLPDGAELILNDMPEDDFIVDKDTFCYFRDEVFIKNIKQFIEKKVPGKLKEIEGYSDAEKVSRLYDNNEVIHKYYPKYDKIREKYYLYEGDIYMYKFMGFGNIGLEIQLMKLEKKDILFSLNNPKIPLF